VVYHHGSTGSSLGTADILRKVWNTIHITNTYFIKDRALEIRKEMVSEHFLVLLHMRTINRKIKINMNG
jgi:hypothetical protein